MTKVTTTIGIVLLVIVVLALCAWRATTQCRYWHPIDYIGILAFGFTLLTAWFAFFIKREVKQLSEKYSMKLALPLAQKNVEKIRKELLPFVSRDADFTKKRVEILEIVANCLSECEHLDRKTRDLSVEFSTVKGIVLLCREIKHGKQITKDVIEKLYSDVFQLKKDIDKIIQDLNHEVKI